MTRGIIVVTGSVSGIGRATALQLADQGYDVIPTMRRDEPLPSPVMPPVLMDIGDADSIEPACQEILDRCEGRIAGLVNNAGISVTGPFEALPLSEWRRQFEVNLFGHLAVTKQLLPALLAAKGRIVNVGSIGGRMSLPFLAPYNASKFAMHAWSDALRLELGPHGVRVVLVEPGAIKTPFWGKGTDSANALVDELDSDLRARYDKQLQGAFKAADMSERHAIPPERVAKVITTAITSSRPRGRYLVGPDARVQAGIAMLPSRGYDAVTRRLLGV